MYLPGYKIWFQVPTGSLYTGFPVLDFDIIYVARPSHELALPEPNPLLGQSAPVHLSEYSVADTVSLVLFYCFDHVFHPAFLPQGVVDSSCNSNARSHVFLPAPLVSTCTFSL